MLPPASQPRLGHQRLVAARYRQRRVVAWQAKGGGQAVGQLNAELAASQHGLGVLGCQYLAQWLEADLVQLVVLGEQGLRAAGGEGRRHVAS